MFFLLLSGCLLLKSLNCQPAPAKWAVHLNQNCWPSGIVFEKRTQVGYVNNNPRPLPRPPVRQKKIHCQGDGWGRLLPALVMGCDQHVPPAPSLFLLADAFLWESRNLWLPLLKMLQLPRAEGPSCRCFPPRQWLQSSWSTCGSDVCCVTVPGTGIAGSSSYPAKPFAKSFLCSWRFSQ